MPTSSYTLRAIDRKVMVTAQKRALDEGVSIKDVLLWSLKAYAEGHSTVWPVEKT